MIFNLISASVLYLPKINWGPRTSCSQRQLGYCYSTKFSSKVIMTGSALAIAHHTWESILDQKIDVLKCAVTTNDPFDIAYVLNQDFHAVYCALTLLTPLDYWPQISHG
ncbi:uncharacterized protein N7503_008025 [Penicillium pulvis]|uniref:uncharacterized protein n=1 Tax=Penicillium pulvis TaxID=1562058 RepID=UPI002546DFC4|nr:uncharacterized protein N7503_008025 [Penicillium pulvis]KAJ5792047.1 hypothetical protein N7503_008025 [Penicillium pulvis]